MKSNVVIIPGRVGLTTMIRLESYLPMAEEETTMSQYKNIMIRRAED